MASSTSHALSVPRGVALYVGALLGPGLLMLPGLAAERAGPASVLAWSGLLAISALFAVVFTALGTRMPGGGGVIAYADAGLGPRVGRAVGRCFLTGVVLGAPVVCMIGAGYVTALLGGGGGGGGGGRVATALVAALLLVCVIGLTLAGARTGTTVQMILVGLLLAVIVAAVTGSVHASRAANWTPFAPHGWSAVGTAASVLMLSFVGWEAVAPLTRRLANPRRSLPRITAAAFTVTAAIYLALATTLVAVLGSRAQGPVPVADLLRVAVGAAGPWIAAGAAVMLTFATINAYLTGGTALAAHLRGNPEGRNTEGRNTEGRDTEGEGRVPLFFAATAAAGVVELSAEALGVLDTARMVTLPTSLFLVVYVASMASAARLLGGALRGVAALACAASVIVLAFSGPAAVLAVAVTAVALVTPPPGRAAVRGEPPVAPPCRVII
jgi:amino acid efflux transporter